MSSYTRFTITYLYIVYEFLNKNTAYVQKLLSSNKFWSNQSYILILGEIVLFREICFFLENWGKGKRLR